MQTMRVRKGDLVHILSGKDRGKQGRVLDARPKDRKVVVENLAAPSDSAIVPSAVAPSMNVTLPVGDPPAGALTTALSVTVCVIVQALINISVVLDLLPNKGIPLPFISNGGSSLLSTLLLMGMLLSVSENMT